MMSCEQVRSQLLEHLYDVLDQERGRALTVHLGHCANCQADLGHAREQMALIAAAAKEEFPNVHFVQPTEKTSEVAKTPAFFAARRRLGIRWAVAAAVLFAVSGAGIPAAIYWRQQTQVTQAENTLRGAKDELARANAHRLRILDDAHQVNVNFRRQVDQADKDALLARNDLVRLGQDFQQKKQQTLSEINAKQMDLTVIGPRTIEPGALNQFRIQTRSFRLQPMPARITVVVRDQNQRELFKKEDLESRGDLLVALPVDLPLKPDTTLNLEVQARAEQNRQLALSESLPLTGSLYVTHLTTDKPLYQPGETVRFRSLTLERFSLRPPTDDLEMTYKITNPAGAVTTIARGTAEGVFILGPLDKPIGAIGLGPLDKPIRGVGAGEHTIDRQAPAGQYTLMVSEAQQRFPAQERRFIVVRPGEAKSKNGPMIRPSEGDSQLPTVEFFPESGDLVAGVPNRVYFQARTSVDPAATLRHLLLDRVYLESKSGELKGRIVDDAGKEITQVVAVSDSTRPKATHAIGVFEFTPQLGKRYQLKIDTPVGIEGQHLLPAAKAGGVVMSIPNPANSAKEPIRVKLWSIGADRSLLVGAYCRGRLMAQQTVDVKKDDVKQVELGPETGVGGVYRVTVFERAPDQARGERLEPRAERLIYRRPAGRLRLNVHQGTPDYVHGERVYVRVTATNENNKPQPAIVAVAVVDQGTFGRDKTYRSLPAHFLLAPDLHWPEDLKQAVFLLSDDPQAAKALDLLLGTQGWRRFAEQDPEKFQKEHKLAAQRLLALEGQWPPRSVNYGQEAVQKVVKEFHRHYAALEKRLTEAELLQVVAQNRDGREMKRLQEQAKQAESERIAAVGHVTSAQESLAVAADNFQHYRELLQGVVLPAILIAFMLATVVNLVLAIRRRSQGKAIPYLAGAACSLLLVALALNQRANLLAKGASTEIEVAERSDSPNNDWMDQIKLDERFAKQAPVLGDKPPRPLIGQIKPIGPQPPEKKDKDQKQPAVKPEELVPRDRRNLLPRMPVPPPPPPPFVVREYTHLRASGDNNLRADSTGLLYWHPAFALLPDGTAEISFDLTDSATTYQVIVAGHTLDGQLAEEIISIPVKKPGNR